MKYIAKYFNVKNAPLLAGIGAFFLYATLIPLAVADQPAPTGQPEMTQAQFQQWLQGNGVAAAAGATGTPPVSPTTTVQTQTSSPNAIAPGNSSTATTTTTQVAAQPVNPQMFASNTTQQKRRKLLPWERGQKVMLDSVPDTGPAPGSDADYAFRALLQQNMPLSPRQVVQLHQQIDIAQRAAATPANIPPKPVSTTLMVNLAPGTTPPAIRLAQGYVSSLVFVDSTGAPWPIAAFDIGNPKALNIQWDGKSNILLMQAVSPYSDGNIVLRLVGLQTPITLELVTGQRVVDYRVDIHVSGLGPNSKDLPMGESLPASANELLLGVLDGVAPPGGRALQVRGADAQAWLMGERMYLRTRLTVLSPGWIGKMTSSDGMQAYELPRTSSVLVSRYGEPAELKIEGF